MSTTACWETEVTEVQRGEMPYSPIKIMMNIGNPHLAFDFAQMPNSGVGLARLEFIINNNIGVHPRAILDISERGSGVEEGGGIGGTRPRQARGPSTWISSPKALPPSRRRSGPSR